MKILRGGLQKFLDTRKGAMKKLGGAPKICILQNQQERGGHWTASKGAAKISSFEFPPPLVISNDLSLTAGF